MKPTLFAEEQRRLGHDKEEDCAWMFKTTPCSRTRSGALEAWQQTFWRIRAAIEINGERREMTFLTNNKKTVVDA